MQKIGSRVLLGVDTLLADYSRHYRKLTMEVWKDQNQYQVVVRTTRAVHSVLENDGVLAEVKLAELASFAEIQPAGIPLRRLALDSVVYSLCLES